MNYNQIILELLDRIKKLENRVAQLENSNNVEPSIDNSKQVEYIRHQKLTDRARDYIKALKKKAKDEGKTEIILLCNDIQKALGVTNRPAGICTVMYECMEENDEILSAPPSGKSTTVLIKYYL